MSYRGVPSASTVIKIAIMVINADSEEDDADENVYESESENAPQPTAYTSVNIRL